MKELDFEKLEKVLDENQIVKTDYLMSSTGFTETKTNESNTKKKEQKRTTEGKIRFLENFQRGLGIITDACASTGINATTYFAWMQNDEEFKAKIEELKKAQYSKVEGKLLKAIEDGNIAAIIFYLKSKHPEYKPALQLDGSLNLKSKYEKHSDEQIKERVRELLNRVGEKIR